MEFAFEPVLKDEIANFLHKITNRITFPSEISLIINKHNENESNLARSAMFSVITRSMREYCIELSEKIYITSSYSFHTSLLAQWYQYRDDSVGIARQTSSFYSSHFTKIPDNQAGFIELSAYRQLLGSFYSSWQKYVLGASYIDTELKTCLSQISESTLSFPYNLNTLQFRLKRLYSILKDPFLSSQHNDIKRLIQIEFRLFDKHPVISQNFDTKQAIFLADSLTLSSSFLDKLLCLDLTYEMKQEASHIMLLNPTYRELCLMKLQVDPEAYEAVDIPQQINEILKFREGKLQGNISFIENKSFYLNDLSFLFECAIEILSVNQHAASQFRKLFARKLFDRTFLRGLNSLPEFPDLTKLGRMICANDSHVTHVARLVESYYTSASIKLDIDQINAELSDLMLTFMNHPTMLLARRRIVAKFQSDKEKVDRARYLIERALDPKSMRRAISELNVYMDSVGNKSYLFDNILQFLKALVINDYDPNPGVLEELLKMVSQNQNPRLIDPFREMISDFKQRHQLFDSISKRVSIRKGITITLLKSSLWSEVITPSNLPVFKCFDELKSVFEDYVKEKKGKVRVRWSDSNSLVVATRTVDGHDYKYLFTGSQYSIVHELMSGPKLIYDLSRETGIPDIREKAEGLVSGNLVRLEGDKMSLVEAFDMYIHRDFAKRGVSTDTEVTRMSSEISKAAAVEASVMKLLKAAVDEGIVLKDIVQSVIEEVGSFTSVEPRNVRDAVVKLDRMGMIECSDIVSRKFRYKR